MENVKYEIKGNKLVIEVDLSPAVVANAPASKTGTTMLVASTRGSERLPTQPSFGGKRVSFALNVTRER